MHSSHPRGTHSLGGIQSSIWGAYTLFKWAHMLAGAISRPYNFPIGVLPNWVSWAAPQLMIFLGIDALL
jgi:hypothetical protein